MDISITQFLAWDSARDKRNAQVEALAVVLEALKMVVVACADADNQSPSPSCNRGTHHKEMLEMSATFCTNIGDGEIIGGMSLLFSYKSLY